MKYGTTKLTVPAVVQPQTNGDPPAPHPATFGELRRVLKLSPESLKGRKGLLDMEVVILD
jgi:hypothetical protein